MTKQRYQNIPAYVLHTRKFRDTSLLIEFFTAEIGRCSAVAKGVYQGKSPKKSLLQPFMPLQISLQGSTELLSLTSVEMVGAPIFFQGESLACGLYLNELLSYTLHRYDAHPLLFQSYQHVLPKLENQTAIALREFELILLDELGYGIHWPEPDQHTTFYFEAGRGFVPTMQTRSDRYTFTRQVMQQIANKDWQPETLKAAKYLTRLAFAPLLAGKTIFSRELLKS